MDHYFWIWHKKFPLELLFLASLESWPFVQVSGNETDWSSRRRLRPVLSLLAWLAYCWFD